MSEPTLVEAWDIYDLDDAALRAQFECATRLAQQGVLAAKALLVPLEEELKERGQSTVILAGIEGQPLPEATPPTTPSPKTSAPPSPAPEAAVPLGDAAPSPPRRRGLWDTDSDVSSEDEHPKKPPPLMRRRAGAGFVAFASTRKKPKEKLLPPAPQRKTTTKGKVVQKPSTAERTTRKPAVPRLSSTPLPRPGQNAKGAPNLAVPRKGPPRLASLVSTTLPVAAAAVPTVPERSSSPVAALDASSDADFSGLAVVSPAAEAAEAGPLASDPHVQPHAASDSPAGSADGPDAASDSDQASTERNDDDDTASAEGETPSQVAGPTAPNSPSSRPAVVPVVGACRRDRFVWVPLYPSSALYNRHALIIHVHEHRDDQRESEVNHHRQHDNLQRVAGLHQ